MSKYVNHVGEIESGSNSDEQTKESHLNKIILIGVTF